MIPGTTITPGTTPAGSNHPGTATGDRSVVELETTVGAGAWCAGCEDACGGDQDSALSRRNQRGMVSAEWAVGIIAAVAIAGVLLGIVTSGPVHDALLNFILMVIRSFSGFVK
jgi:Protein of unknown function (DUF4244)